MMSKNSNCLHEDWVRGLLIVRDKTDGKDSGVYGVSAGTQAEMEMEMDWLGTDKSTRKRGKLISAVNIHDEV